VDNDKLICPNNPFLRTAKAAAEISVMSKKFGMRNILHLILLLGVILSSAYANEIEGGRISDADNTSVLKKSIKIPVKRGGNKEGIIIKDIGEVNKVKSEDIVIEYKPPLKRGEDKIIDLNKNKFRPQNPEELYSCEDIDAQNFYDGEVCALQIEIVYCVRAPCPPMEKWMIFHNSETACSTPGVKKFALGRCIYDDE
jgi:hypothetical protein